MELAAAPTADTDDSPHAVLNTPTARLWLESRRKPSSEATTTGTYIPPGEDRALTLANLRVAFALVPLLWSRFALLFWSTNRLRMVAFVCGKLLKGVLPAFKIWAASQLLDQVQESFSAAGKDIQVDQAKVIRMAVVSLVASASNTLFDFVSQTNDTIIRQYLNHHVERLFLSSQLSLDIPTLSDPIVNALMYEAGCFAGFERREQRPGAMFRPGGKGPFQTLQGFFGTLTCSVEVISQAGLLIRTLSLATQNVELNGNHSGRLGSSFPFNYIPVPDQSFLLIFLSFLPSLFSVFSTLSSLTFSSPSGTAIGPPSGKTKRNAVTKRTWQTARREEAFIKDLGRNGSYKQEVVLFGLGGWVLEKWDELRQAQIRDGLDRRFGIGYWQLGWGVGEEAVQTLFYVSRMGREVEWTGI
jgi:hypothetical protein